MKYRVFISSVQGEFAAERRGLKEYLLTDALLREYVEDVFIFEDVPAERRQPDEVYVGAVESADIFIGLYGCRFGHVFQDGTSPTEREYDAASRRNVPLWLFYYDKDAVVDERMARLRRRIDTEHTRRTVHSDVELFREVYNAFISLLRERRQLFREPFDVSEAKGATLDDIDVGVVEWFAKTAAKERGLPASLSASPETLFRHLRLMDGERLSNAALLLFGKDPRRICLSSMVKCVFCAGREYRRPFIQQVYDGTLFNQIDQAWLFVLSHIDRKVGFVGDTVKASQAYDLPKDAVREAIVNAVAHRDYFSKASVEVRLFSDRLEVWNPGEMPEGLPLSWLYSEHPSLPFNSLLADPLYLVRYIERAGTGIDVIVDGCKELGLMPPKFDVRNGFFVVTLYRHPEENKTGVKTDKKTGVKTGVTASKKTGVRTGKKTSVKADGRSGIKTRMKTSDAIVELMRVNPMISYVMLAKMLDREQSSIIWQIARLKKRGLIRRIGPRNGGHWEVLDSQSE